MRFCLPGCTFLVLLLTLTACSEPKSRFATREVVMPDGRKIYAESAISAQDLLRGLMFRDEVAKDGGMLFFHNQMGRYTYFMYQVRVPLDIIWMDSTKRVVEIAANVPPCKEEKASQCPNYGGNQDAQFILELAGGMAEKYGVKVGTQIEF
jgi:uncharacterized membrane protein (UPF0127 family)